MTKIKTPRAPRVAHRVSVKILLNDSGVVCEMLDFSETGMFIAYAGDEDMINIGDKVEVQTLEFDGAPIVPAQVVRLTSIGFAVRFLLDF
jgi:hypothetical protein